MRIVFVLLALLISTPCWAGGNYYLGATGGAGGVATTTINGAAFDGANDELVRGADLTGAADGKEFTLSLWFQMTGGDGATQSLVTMDNNTGPLLGVRVQRLSTNVVRVVAYSTAQAALITMDSTTTFVADSTWHHLLASCDLATASSCDMYIDGSAEDVGNTGTNANIDLTTGFFDVGGRSAYGDQKTNAYLGDFWFEDTYLDVSVAGNRDKFYYLGDPVDLGTDGSTPTGASPLVYLGDDNDYTNWETNNGTGGNFTVTGALGDGGTYP